MGRSIGRPLLTLLLLGAPAVASAATFTVNSTADGPDVAPGNGACNAAGGVCTLRAAVMEANALAGADVVQVGALHCQLTLIGGGDGAGDLDLTSDLEIAGGGGVVTAAPGIDRVLEVSAGTASVHDLTLRPLGATGNPACLLATAPLAAANLLCDSPPILWIGFETGDLTEWTTHLP